MKHVVVTGASSGIGAALVAEFVRVGARVTLVARRQAEMQAIAANLTDGASGLVEVPNFDMILRAGLFAEFIPDHLFYFTRQTLTALLERNGFDVLDCRPAWHDYVLSATVRKRRPLDLSPLLACQDALKAAFDAFLARFAPGRVAIWGAGHQALALISLMDLAPRIAYVVDSAPFKQGRYTPATHLPIVAPERLAAGMRIQTGSSLEKPLDLAALVAAGIVRRPKDGVRLLGDGEKRASLSASYRKQR